MNLHFIKYYALTILFQVTVTTSRSYKAMRRSISRQHLKAYKQEAITQIQVFNIGNVPLSNNEKQLLSYNLSFSPTPKPLTNDALHQALERTLHIARMRWKKKDLTSDETTAAVQDKTKFLKKRKLHVRQQEWELEIPFRFRKT
jgi:hypothetical protein